MHNLRRDSTHGVGILQFFNEKTKRKTMAISYMTKEGFDKKMAELAHLENVERPEVVRAIAEARDKGDLSENAEYDAAKERQGMLEAKIAELKNLVATARIIDESKITTDEVQLLNKVTIKNVKNGAQMTYTLVTETESNLREGKISITTPIAKGLLGHKVGDVVDVNVPAGVMKFEIVDISI
jgi:transcription elongation factor GreA